MAVKEVVGVESKEEEDGGAAKLRRWVVRCAMLWRVEREEEAFFVLIC